MPPADTTAPVGARTGPRLRAACLVALLALALAPGLALLARVWSSSDYLAHGFLIAPIAAALAFAQRRALAALPAGEDARGRAVIAACLAVYLFGFLAQAPMFVGLGAVGALAGCVLALRGAASLRALAFPLAFLLFMVPLPPAWISPILNALRLVASELATDLVRAFGFPVSREGNVIVLPGGRLFVAEACSGISSVVALLPAAVLLAHFRRDRRLGACLIASVVPIAVFWNLIRVAATVLGSFRFGIERAAASDLHEAAGVLTFLMGCLTLVAVDAVALGLRAPRRQRAGRALP